MEKELSKRTSEPIKARAKRALGNGEIESPKTRLADAIDACRSNKKLTLQRIASAAHVSINTLLFVLNGEGPYHPKTFNKKFSKRELQGRAEVLTRLALYVHVDKDGRPLNPEEVVKEFGLEPQGDVLASINRVSNQHGTLQGVTDDTLNTIGAHGEVIAGILRWPPFFKENDEEISESWAWRFTHRLISSLNPEWKCQSREIETIAEALDAVIGERKEKKRGCDVVFGIYDTPYRRLRGLSFIHLPGLGIPLGALYRPQEGSEITWDRILGPVSRIDPLRAVVIEKEVGHLFLWGPCRYPPSDLKILKETDTDAIATGFLEALENSEKMTVFVADAVTCKRVRDKLKLVKSVEEKDSSHPLAPIYRLGLAVHAASPRWLELLEMAQTEELFRNAMGLTASLYAELLATTSDKEVCLLPLEPTLPTVIAEKFSQAVDSAFSDFEQSRYPSLGSKHIENRKDACRTEWANQRSKN